MTNWLGRRRYPRYPIVLPFKHESRSPEDPGVGAGWTRDLSEAGAGLELARRFEPSTPLRLCLRSDTAHLCLEATVAWTGHPSEAGTVLHGVTFRPMPAQAREALHGLLLRKRMLWQGRIRVPVDLPVTCHEKSQSRPPFHGRTENVSRGGLLLRLPLKCPPGTPLEVILRTPAGPLEAEGLIVRVEPLDAQVPGAPIGHGFRFTSISAAAQMGLCRVLAGAC